MQACPKYVSHRETIVNIKLITTTLIVLKRNYLSHNQIRHGLNAYTLICREHDEKEDKKEIEKKEGDKKYAEYEEKEDVLTLTKDGGKTLSFHKVHKALRMINMSVSDDLLKKWLDHVLTNLDWNNQERRDFERSKR